MNEEILTAGFAELFKLTSGVIAGPGDDCAVLEIPGSERLMLAAVDQVIENIHYLPGEPAERVAGKLLRRNISDIAAMGGSPAYVLLSLAWNPLDEERLRCFHSGMNEECKAYGIGVIGGDVAGQSAKGIVSSLSILGFAERGHVRLRSGAKAGDYLVGTGCYGRSFETGHHLTFRPRLQEGLYLGGLPFIHSMMDVSDGLLKDSLRMASASGLGLRYDYDSIPRRDKASVEDALCDGEDYELVFSADPSSLSALLSGWPFAEKPSVLGRFEKAAPGVWLNPIRLNKKGYDHFHE